MPKGIYERHPHAAPRSAKDRAQIGERMRALHKRLWVENYEDRRQISADGGSVACAFVRRCHDCGREIRGPRFFGHQRQLGHFGFTVTYDPTKQGETA